MAGRRPAGRWPYSPVWTPLRFLQLPGGDDALHLSGRATLKTAAAEATGEPPPGPVPENSTLPNRSK